MHHGHVTFIIFQLLPLHKVEDAEQQNTLKRVYHDYIDHVGDLLVNVDLILKSIVLNESVVCSSVVVGLNL